MPLPFSFDFKKPDYVQIFEWRLERLENIRKNPATLPPLEKFYRDNPAQFIIDWGCTSDPRNVEDGLPATIPFLLFPKQEEWIHWILDCWHKKSPGLTEKSREMGISWVATAFSATMCLFHRGMKIGFGSRKQEYVDRLGDSKSLLFKVRKFIELLPREFRKDWNPKRHAPFMRVGIPHMDSAITGESGDNIGRGDRTSIFFTDEKAWIPRSELVDAALSQTTRCRIDISTPRGMNNSFARQIHERKLPIFTYKWTEDPRKDQAWYDKQVREINDSVIVAQEIDLSYSASQEGILIPAEWVKAAIGADKKLGLNVSGRRILGFDVADKGMDFNAVAGKQGNKIVFLQSWKGSVEKGIYASVEKVFSLCDLMDFDLVYYDADGLGAGVRGDAKAINDKLGDNLVFEAFVGSGAVDDPEGDPFRRKGDARNRLKGRTNDDYFQNYKAQSWFFLRRLFQNTYQAIHEGKQFNDDELIIIDENLSELRELELELSQVVYVMNEMTGKMMIDKTPDGTRSPNRADAVMIVCGPRKMRQSFFAV